MGKFQPGNDLRGHRDLGLTDSFKPEFQPGLDLPFQNNLVLVVHFPDLTPSVPSVIPDFGLFVFSQAIQGT